MKEKNKMSKKHLIILIIIVFLTSFILFFVFSKNDGMEQSGILDIKYRTYDSKSNEWSKWTKNGMTSGDFENDISNLQIKLNDRNVSGTITYQLFNSDGIWTYGVSIDEKNKNQKFRGIRMSTTGMIYKKYNLCYRTYNSENKWMDWSCEAIINGNINKNIKAIQIKIVPKNVILRDYLNDYNLPDSSSSIGFY